MVKSYGETALKKLIVVLDNFHTQMSFLGIMGHIMENSGLPEIFESTYARNSVKRESGKAQDRAVRAIIFCQQQYSKEKFVKWH